MLTCKQLTELVTDYAEGRLSFWRRLEVQMHLGMCRHCRAYLRQVKVTVETLGAMPIEPIPEDVKAELLERFKRLGPTPPPPEPLSD